MAGKDKGRSTLIAPSTEQSTIRRAKKAKQRAHTRKTGGSTTFNIFDERKNDQRQLAAEATMVALEQKLRHDFDKVVAQKGCDLYAAGMRLHEVIIELRKEFDKAGTVGIRAFYAEIRYQMSRPQAALAMA